MTTTDQYTLPPKPGFFADIYLGAVHGDFAPRLGVPGLTTQIVMGFIPVVGTCCAFRDFIADRRKHDRLGAMLNALALIPFLGGFPKTAAVLHSVRHVGHVIHKAQKHQENTQAGSASAPTSPTK
jgi:hypothetical protein